MWRIWYDNDTTFGNEDGSPQLAPGRGVICIVQDDERTGRLRLTGDYYIWQHGRWFAVDLFGLWDYLSGKDWKCVKFGRFATYDRYAAICQRAEADMRMPERSGWNPGEERVNGR